MDGNVVKPNGVGKFKGRVAIGDYLGTPGTQHIVGPGLLDPTGAEVHFAVKYHGPASDKSKPERHCSRIGHVEKRLADHLHMTVIGPATAPNHFQVG